MKQNTTPQMSLMAFVRLMLHKWPLFLCSIIFFLGVIFVLKKRAVVGDSEYKIGLMTRFFEGSKESVLTEKNEPLLIWRMAPAYTPSQLYGWLVSADIIYRCGMREGFDVEYYQDNIWGKFDVYNNMPIRLFFLDAKEMDTFTLDCFYSEGKAYLSNFRGTFRGEEIEKQQEYTIEGVGQSVETPFGRVLMADNPGWDEYEKTPLDLNKKINIRRLKGIDIRAKYDWDMNLSLNQGTVFTLKVKTSGSSRRSLQVLNAMLEECNEVVRYHVLEDLAKERELLQASIDSISSPTLTSLSPEVKREQLKFLEQYLAQNITNSGISMYKRMIEITDPPMIQPAPSGSLYVRLILLLLAIVIPMGIVYIIWFYKGAILERKQLSEFWQSTSPLKIKGRKKTLPSSSFDALLHRIKGDFGPQQQDSKAQRLPAKSILLTTPTSTKEANYWIRQIIEAFKKAGHTIRVVELQNSSGDKIYSESHVVKLKTGYLLSEAFAKDMALSAEEASQNVISIFIVPADKLAILQNEVTSTVVLLLPEKTRVEDLTTVEEGLTHTSTSLNTVHTLWIERGLFF